MPIVRRIHLSRAQLGPADAETGARARVVLTGDQSRYLVSVLRLAPGEPLEVFDGEGARYPATLRLGVDGKALLEVGEQLPKTINSPALEVMLAQALAKADKLELVIQKATELGCARVIPFAAERCVVKLENVGDERGEKKLVRWRKIAEEAARQSGRADVPEIAAPQGWEDLFALVARDPELRAIALDPLAAALRLGAAAMGAQRVLLAIGPEGGFSPEELARAEEHGFVRASLGERILRTETAGLAALAVVQHLAGQLG